MINNKDEIDFLIEEKKICELKELYHKKNEIIKDLKIIRNEVHGKIISLVSNKKKISSQFFSIKNEILKNINEKISKEKLLIERIEEFLNYKSVGDIVIIKDDIKNIKYKIIKLCPHPDISCDSDTCRYNSISLTEKYYTIKTITDSENSSEFSVRKDLLEKI